MAIQNRMALDMLLAKEGGVCTMIGGSCCTFIPNNTAPDGSVTKALAGLTALSERMAEDSGVDNVLSGLDRRAVWEMEGLNPVSPYVHGSIYIYYCNVWMLLYTLYPYFD